jgi:hypothetical protein
MYFKLETRQTPKNGHLSQKTGVYEGAICHEKRGTVVLLTLILLGDAHGGSRRAAQTGL